MSQGIKEILDNWREYSSKVVEEGRDPHLHDLIKAAEEEEQMRKLPDSHHTLKEEEPEELNELGVENLEAQIKAETNAREQIRSKYQSIGNELRKRNDKIAALKAKLKVQRENDKRSEEKRAALFPVLEE